MRSARTPAQFGTRRSARSGLGGKMWRDETRRGRAGQAIQLYESGVVDGTTANSLAASYRGPRQDGQVAKTKFLARNCLRGARREHPCFVPYDELPVEQKKKDALFKAVIDALR